LKGVITVIGAQDISELRATYGHERADAWVGMIGTNRVPARYFLTERVLSSLFRRVLLGKLLAARR
jgi:hypothetical protein